MSSVVIKVGSLLIKTLSKPIAVIRPPPPVLIASNFDPQNKIKEQARNHERFRRVCVQSAQAIHRWDMRFKLGLLQDTATQEKQAKREAAEAQAAKHKQEAPTVKTEAQTLADEEKAAKEKEREERGERKAKEPAKAKVKIRPLSEAKAIDSGANFVSETFLLLVGVALILGENWRQNRKQKSRREDVAERIGELEEYEKSARKGLVELEKEILRLRQGTDAEKVSRQQRILPPEVYELEEKESGRRQPVEQGWWLWLKENTVGDWKKKDREQGAASGTNEKPTIQASEEPTSMTSPPPASTSILSKILPSPKEIGESPKTSESPSKHIKNAVKAPFSN